MAKHFLYILLLLCSVKNLLGSSQAKDSLVSIFIGNTFSYDITILTSDTYKREKYKYRPSFTNLITSEFKLQLGKKKKLGVSFEPRFGYKQVSFKAIIPSNDFNNPPDSLIITDEKYLFYENNQTKSGDEFLYRRSYWKMGFNLNLTVQLNKKNNLYVGVGFNRLVFNHKNYPDYSYYRAFSGSVAQNNYSFVNLFKQESKANTKTILIGIEHKFTRRISVRSTIETNSDSMLDFRFSPNVNLIFFVNDVIKDYYTPSITFTLTYSLL